MLHSPHVGLVDEVPRGHVFLHALGGAGLFAVSEGASGFGDALVETGLVDFLSLPKKSVSLSLKLLANRYWLIVAIPSRTYLDELPRVLNVGLEDDLPNDGLLD